MIRQKLNFRSDNSTTNLSKILKSELHKRNLNISDLAREINLPQSTLNQLLLGISTAPRITTLIPIAQYFDMSLDDLMGIAPSRSPTKQYSSVPLIEWSDVIKWADIAKDLNPITHKQWIVTDKDIDRNSFALQSTRAMEPLFRASSILIVDTKKIIADGSYVIFGQKDGSEHCKVKRVLKDGGDIFLEPINNMNTIPNLLYSEINHIIFGYIKEVRLAMQNN